MSFGEKFIERKIEGNKVIITNEFKEFDFNYNLIADYVNDYVTDDPEELFLDYGVIYNYDEIYAIDCNDLLLEKIKELIKEAIKDGEATNELVSFVLPLKEASGYTIYLNKIKGEYDE